MPLPATSITSLSEGSDSMVNERHMYVLCLKVPRLNRSNKSGSLGLDLLARELNTNALASCRLSRLGKSNSDPTDNR